MSKRGASTMALTPQQQAKVAKFRKLNLIKPPSAEVKKNMTAKASKRGGTLSFLVEGTWTAHEKNADGSKSASTVKVTPTVKNTKLIGKWLPPDSEELDRCESFSLYGDEGASDRGTAVTVYASKEMKDRANAINAMRSNEKNTSRALWKQKCPDWTDEQIEEQVFLEWGDDVTFAEKEMLSNATTTFLPLPKVEDCENVEKLLHVQPFTKITFYNVQFNSSVMKISNSKEFRGKCPKAPHALPSGTARTFFNASKVLIDKLTDETLIAALRLIDETNPGVHNPHVKHWLPDLQQMHDAAQASDNPQARYYGPLIQRFQSKEDFNRMVFPEGMVSTTSINEEKIQSGMPNVEYPTLDLLCTVMQWRLGEEQLQKIENAQLAAIDAAAAEGLHGADVQVKADEAGKAVREDMSFEVEESKSILYCVNLTAYGKHETDKSKPSQLEMCPIQDVNAWKTLAPYYFSNLDFFAQYKIDVENSVAHPSNGGYEERLNEAKTNAAFNKEPLYVLKTFLSRLLIPFVELTEMNCVPLSLEECKQFAERLGNRRPELQPLQSEKAVVVALNNMSSDAQSKYFTGEKHFMNEDAPRYEFYALLPVRLDSRQRDVFGQLRESLREGYAGPLGGVLLNQDYHWETADECNAHKAIVEEKLAPVPVTSEQVSNSMFLLVVDRNRYAQATMPDKVKACQRNMFGMFKDKVQVAAAAPEADE